jgi:hypothetical protein
MPSYRKESNRYRCNHHNGNYQGYSPEATLPQIIHIISDLLSVTLFSECLRTLGGTKAVIRSGKADKQFTCQKSK